MSLKLGEWSQICGVCSVSDSNELAKNFTSTNFPAMNEEREHHEPRRSPPRREGGTSGAAVAGLGMQFVVAILLFLFLGKWLDERFGTTPWLLIAGVFLGAGASFYSIYRRLMADQKRDDEARKRP